MLCELALVAGIITVSYHRYNIDKIKYGKCANKFAYDYYLFKSVFRIVVEKKLVELKRITEIVVLMEKIEEISGIDLDFVELL